MPVQVPRLPLVQHLRVLRVLVLLGAHAQAGRAASLSGTATASIETTPTLVERTENLGRLYHSQDNPVLQDLWFLGRYHGQYYWAEGSRGADDDWENRRFQIGGQARLFQRLTVLAQMVGGPDMDPFYGGFTELWVGWRFTDAVTLTIGQQKHRFTYDRSVSSRYVNYLERAQLTQMFALDYTPAVTLSGEVGEWTYYGGLFSNVTGSEMGEAFTEFGAGGSLLGNATRNLGRSLGTDTAYLNFGLVASDANKNASNLNHFDYGLSSALILTKGPVSLVTEVTAGLGSNDGNAAGLNLQPGWFLTDTTQLVARYQLSVSDDERGLRAQKRYERAAGMTAGDLYQAVYLGLNRYIVGHRPKLMSGVEYATLGEGRIAGRPRWRCVSFGDRSPAGLSRRRRRCQALRARVLASPMAKNLFLTLRASRRIGFPSHSFTDAFAPFAAHKGVMLS